jgi:hypothetical protein
LGLVDAPHLSGNAKRQPTQRRAGEPKPDQHREQDDSSLSVGVLDLPKGDLGLLFVDEVDRLGRYSRSPSMSRPTLLACCISGPSLGSSIRAVQNVAW